MPKLMFCVFVSAFLVGCSQLDRTQRQPIEPLPAADLGGQDKPDQPDGPLMHPCDDGLTTCGATCVDTQTDPLNCGGCNLHCPTLSHSIVECADSTCWLTDCAPGWSECDGNAANGCEKQGACGNNPGGPDLAEPTASTDLAKPTAPPADMSTPEPPALRPIVGDTARLRYLNLTLIPGFDRKVCIFAAGDVDERPYAVLTSAGHDASEKSYHAEATYVTIPAGVELVAQSFYAIAPLPGDALTKDCDRTKATSLPPPYAQLTKTPRKNAYYTVVESRGSFSSYCIDDADDTSECAFYPDTSSVATKGPCASGGRYLIEDGLVVGGKYVGGQRVINLTDNASLISFSREPNTFTPSYHLLTGKPANTYYMNKTKSGYLCPYYVTHCPVESPTLLAAYELLADCSNGKGWNLAHLDDARFESSTKNTTVYVVGESRFLGPSGGTIGTDLQLVIAHDITDGDLP